MKIILNLQRSFFIFLSALLITLASSLAIAQTPAKNKNPFPVKYTSEVDEKINLHTITLAPVYDNVKRVYAEPIQKLLVELLQNDKVWGYSPFPETNKKIFVETYDTKPAEVLEVLNQASSQGLLTAIIAKGPNGLNAKLRLYTLDQGLILAEESFQDLTTFEIPRLREEFITLYQNIKNKMPYRGLILSRRGLEVTLNAGSKNGLVVGQELALAQILKLNRHPKLKYMVSTEKEIIGRVQITKVEPYLSFAQIIFEKETGVVDVGAKILPTQFISYPRPIVNSVGDVIGDQITAKPSLADANISTEKSKDPSGPHIGKVIIEGGVSQYDESGRFNIGGSADTSQKTAPTLFLNGEFWFGQHWFVNFDILQSSFKSQNNLIFSTPTDLNYSYARYTGSVGYYFLVNDDFWGPKASAQLGFSSYKTDVTDTSPTAFTSTSTGAPVIKLAGSFPLEPEFPIEIGASIDLLINPTYSESPTSSQSAVARTNTFGLFASYHVSKTLHFRMDFDFNQIQIDFDGTGLKRSSTIKMNSQLLGLEYSF